MLGVPVVDRLLEAVVLSAAHGPDLHGTVEFRVVLVLADVNVLPPFLVGGLLEELAELFLGDTRALLGLVVASPCILAVGAGTDVRVILAAFVVEHLAGDHVTDAVHENAGRRVGVEVASLRERTNDGDIFRVVLGNNRAPHAFVLVG